MRRHMVSKQLPRKTEHGRQWTYLTARSETFSTTDLSEKSIFKLLFVFWARNVKCNVIQNIFFVVYHENDHLPTKIVVPAINSVILIFRFSYISSHFQFWRWWTGFVLIFSNESGANKNERGVCYWERIACIPTHVLHLLYIKELVCYTL